MHLANTTTPLTGNTYSNQPLLALSLCNRIEDSIRKGDRMGWMPIETIADIDAGVPCKWILQHMVAQLPNEHMVAFFGAELVGEIVEYVKNAKP